MQLYHAIIIAIIKAIISCNYKSKEAVQAHIERTMLGFAREPRGCAPGGPVVQPAERLQALSPLRIAIQHM